MLSRRTLLGRLSALPFFGGVKTSSVLAPSPVTKLPFYVVDQYDDQSDLSKIFPDGIEFTIENSKKIVDLLGIDDATCFPITGRFETVTDDCIKIHYYRFGQLHRVDGPAVEYANGRKEWWLNDKLHRVDGPAIEYASGTKEWYLSHKRHRVDGPAIECANGHKEWYLNDKLHRVDGPAIECANGTKKWYLNDERHRVDGPAVEYADGRKEWYLNDKLHRVDGPAVEYVNGHKEWWLNDKRYKSFELWQDAVLKIAG